MPRRFTCLQTVTHPTINRVRRTATMLIEANALPLSQTTEVSKGSMVKQSNRRLSVRPRKSSVVTFHPFLRPHTQTHCCWMNHVLYRPCRWDELCNSKLILSRGGSADLTTIFFPEDQYQFLLGYNELCVSRHGPSGYGSMAVCRCGGCFSVLISFLCSLFLVSHCHHRLLDCLSDSNTNRLPLQN